MTKDTRPCAPQPPKDRRVHGLGGYTLTDKEIGIEPDTELKVQQQILKQMDSIRGMIAFFMWIFVISALATVAYLLANYLWD